MPSQGTNKERGYDHHHRAERSRWKTLVDTGTTTCWRCGQLIDPTKPWDLGHQPGTDPLERRYAGPEHIGRDCPAGGNRATKRSSRRPPEPHPGLRQTPR